MNNELWWVWKQSVMEWCKLDLMSGRRLYKTTITSAMVASVRTEIWIRDITNTKLGWRSVMLWLFVCDLRNFNHMSIVQDKSRACLHFLKILYIVGNCFRSWLWSKEHPLTVNTVGLFIIIPIFILSVYLCDDRHSDVSHKLNSSPGTARITKWKRMRWAGHAEREGKLNIYTKLWLENWKEKDQSERLSVNGRIILKRTSRGSGTKMWTQFVWLCVRTGGRIVLKW